MTPKDTKEEKSTEFILQNDPIGEVIFNGIPYVPKELLLSEEKRVREETIVTERMRCYEIIHKHFMESANRNVLDELEQIQKEVLSTNT